jgi:protein that interacts with mitotic cyclin clb2p
MTTLFIPSCEINWNKGKNVTVKTIMRKQKHKTKGTTRQIPKQVPSDSFFNFFSPPESMSPLILSSTNNNLICFSLNKNLVPDDDTEINEEIQAILSADFEIGEIIRHRLIPRAVLYFTGEALMDDYDDEEDEFETEDEEEESEEESEEEEEAKNKSKSKGNERKAKIKGDTGGKQENPPECKQQ